MNTVIPVESSLILVDSGGFWSHSGRFQWIPAESSHSCRNVRGWEVLRYICQSSKYPSSAALAWHLADEWIPFYTLLKLNPLPSSISLAVFKTRIPRRSANYCSTPSDFRSYVAEHKQLLTTPQARAAILWGGIVGHLAKEHLKVNSVIFGPSSSVTAHWLGYSVEAAGSTYWYDGLSNDELAMICGLYCCYTGNLLDSLYLSLRV